MDQGIPLYSHIWLDMLPADCNALEGRAWTRAEKKRLKQLNLWVTEDGRWHAEGAHVERLMEVVGTSKRARRARDVLSRLPIRRDEAIRQGFTSWGVCHSLPWHTVPSGFNKVALDVFALRCVGFGLGLDLASPLLHPPHRPAEITMRSADGPGTWPGFVRLENP